MSQPDGFEIRPPTLKQIEEYKKFIDRKILALEKSISSGRAKIQEVEKRIELKSFEAKELKSLFRKLKTARSDVLAQWRDSEKYILWLDDLRRTGKHDELVTRVRELPSILKTQQDITEAPLREQIDKLRTLEKSLSVEIISVDGRRFSTRKKSLLEAECQKISQQRLILESQLNSEIVNNGHSREVVDAYVYLFDALPNSTSDNLAQVIQNEQRTLEKEQLQVLELSNDLKSVRDLLSEDSLNQNVRAFVTEKRDRVAANLEAHRIETIKASTERTKKLANRKKREAAGIAHKVVQHTNDLALVKKYSGDVLEQEIKRIELNIEKQRVSLQRLDAKLQNETEKCCRLLEQLKARGKYFGDCDVKVLPSIVKWNQLALYSSLHNRIAAWSETRNLRMKAMELLGAQTRELQPLLRLQNEVVLAERRVESFKSKVETGAIKRKSPPLMAVEDWGDAEDLATLYMKWLGYTDAKRMPDGADGGIDVNSLKAIAQVKDHAKGVTRPAVQQLYGVAAAEKKVPLFFARSYARQAIEWGDLHHVLLFQFNIRGEVVAVSAMAKKILANGIKGLSL
jgi:hypothetical protein